MKANYIVPLLKETFASWSEDKAPRLAAALAYYTVFSLAPLVLLCIAVAGFVLGKDAASGQIVAQIKSTVGPQTAKSIEEIIKNAARPDAGIGATIIGLVTLLLGASGVFGQLQDALNTIWGVAPKPGRSLLATLRDRFISMSMVLGIGFMLLVSLVLSAAMGAVTKFMGDTLPGAALLAPVVDLVISFVVITGLLGMMYKILPDAKIEWRDVWVGAAMTSLLFTVGKLLIGLYLGRSSVGSAYGAAGSLVVLLLWVYYSAQILLMGAEFTKVYAQKFGSRIVPEDDAIAVTAEARAEQGNPARGEPGSPEPAKGGAKSKPASVSTPSRPATPAAQVALTKPAETASAWSKLPEKLAQVKEAHLPEKAAAAMAKIREKVEPVVRNPQTLRDHSQLLAGATLSGLGVALIVRDLLAHRHKDGKGHGVSKGPGVDKT